MNLTPRVRDMIAQALVSGRVDGVPHPFERDPQGLFMRFDEIQIAAAQVGATVQFLCNNVPVATCDINGGNWSDKTYVIRLVHMDARIKIEMGLS